jgi:hypothetical protein
MTRGPRATRRDHGWIDERSRALHARVAEKLSRQPELVGIARENLDRWEQHRGLDTAVEEWRSLLRTLPLADLLRLLTEEGENANRLRQSSPFAGVLTDDERLAVLRYYETL